MVSLSNSGESKSQLKSFRGGSELDIDEDNDNDNFISIKKGVSSSKFSKLPAQTPRTKHLKMNSKIDIGMF